MKELPKYQNVIFFIIGILGMIAGIFATPILVVILCFMYKTIIPIIIYLIYVGLDHWRHNTLKSLGYKPVSSYTKSEDNVS